jgi:hypothetical protein
VNDVIGLLTYPLSQGNRWLPEGAKDLLEKELDERNQQGQKLLKEALGGNDIKEFVGKRTEGIRKDLDAMYRQLGQGDAVFFRAAVRELAALAGLRDTRDNVTSSILRTSRRPLPAPRPRAEKVSAARTTSPKSNTVSRSSSGTL